MNYLIPKTGTHSHIRVQTLYGECGFVFSTQLVTMNQVDVSDERDVPRSTENLKCKK